MVSNTFILPSYFGTPFATDIPCSKYDSKGRQLSFVETEVQRLERMALVNASKSRRSCPKAQSSQPVSPWSLLYKCTRTYSIIFQVVGRKPTTRNAWSYWEFFPRSNFMWQLVKLTAWPQATFFVFHSWRRLKRDDVFFIFKWQYGEIPPFTPLIQSDNHLHGIESSFTSPDHTARIYNRSIKRWSSANVERWTVNSQLGTRNFTSFHDILI